MKPTPPIPPSDDREVRLTALLLGELSAEEAASLRQTISQDAELSRLHDRLKQAIVLAREAAIAPELETTAITDAPKLSAERREKLLATFKVVRPKELRRFRWPKVNWAGVKWREYAALAAMLIGLLVVGAVLLAPTLKSSNPKGAIAALDSDRHFLFFDRREKRADVAGVAVSSSVSTMDGEIASDAALERAEARIVTFSDPLLTGSGFSASLWGSQPPQVDGKVQISGQVTPGRASGRPANADEFSEHLHDAQKSLELLLPSGGQPAMRPPSRSSIPVAATPPPPPVEPATEAQSKESGASGRYLAGIALPPSSDSLEVAAVNGRELERLVRATETSRSTSVDFSDSDFATGKRHGGQGGGMGGVTVAGGAPVEGKFAESELNTRNIPARIIRPLPQGIADTGFSPQGQTAGTFTTPVATPPSVAPLFIRGEADIRSEQKPAVEDQIALRRMSEDAGVVTFDKSEPRYINGAQIDRLSKSSASAPAPTAPPALPPVPAEPSLRDLSAADLVAPGTFSSVLITNGAVALGFGMAGKELDLMSRNEWLGIMPQGGRGTPKDSAPKAEGFFLGWGDNAGFGGGGWAADRSSFTNRLSKVVSHAASGPQPANPAPLGDVTMLGVQDAIAVGYVNMPPGAQPLQTVPTPSQPLGELQDANKAQFLAAKPDADAEGARLSYKWHYNGAPTPDGKDLPQVVRRRVDSDAVLFDDESLRESRRRSGAKAVPADGEEQKFRQNRIEIALPEGEWSQAREEQRVAVGPVVISEINFHPVDPAPGLPVAGPQAEFDGLKDGSGKGDKKLAKVIWPTQTYGAALVYSTNAWVESSRVESALTNRRFNRLERPQDLEKGKDLAHDERSGIEGKRDEKLTRAEQQLEETVVPRPKLAAGAAIPQPEVATAENAFSTFSLNVSDVSFKLAAASLEKGQMPEAATVRSEEFINAFDYRDPEPKGSAPIAFAWERARYPFAHDRDLVRFSVKTAASGRQPGRPLNLVLLLDNSGSMERADRVRIREACLRVLASQLRPEDRVSVVAFARTARLVVDGRSGSAAANLSQEVGQLAPDGGTNLEEAMNVAYRTALKHFLPTGVNRVVLLTDGAANLGDVEPESLKRKVESHRQQGVALDCFGIGWEGLNDELLEALSRNGDGRYGFVNTPEAAQSEFAGQLAGALKVAASDVKVQVEWNPRRVTAYRQIGYAKHQLKKEQFRDNTVDAAEIGAAEAGNALYTVQVNPRGEGPLGVVRVRFKVPGTSDYREHEWPLRYEGASKSLDQSSSALRLAASASAFSEWLVSSPFAAEVTPDKLLGYLRGVPETCPADPRPKKLEWMIRQAKSVSGK